MSFDNVGGTTPVLDTQVLTYIGDCEPFPSEGSDLSAAIAALTQSGEGASPILHSTENSMEFGAGADPADTGVATVGDLDDDVTPVNLFYLDEPTDDGGGGGYFEVSEPVIYVPEGFTVNDLYATEFVLDTTTGIVTINLCFSTDPADFQIAGSTLTSPLAPMASTIDFGLDGPSPLQQGNGSKCVVTITKTTTTTSGSSSFTFLGGLVNYTSNSGGSSTTTTKTLTMEGILRNGRCVLTNGR